MDERDADIFVDQAADVGGSHGTLRQSISAWPRLSAMEYATMAGWLRSGKRTGAQSKEASAATAPVYPPRQ